MVDIGYTAAEHKLGWSTALDLLGYKPGLELPDVGPLSQSNAIAELDQWDGPNFTRSRAALERLHPRQARYIFEGLQATTGAAAVGSVKTYKDRVIALREGTDPDRDDSREADREAVKTLEQRNIFNSEIGAHLSELIAEATKLAPSTEVQEDTTRDEAYQRKAHEFHAWLTDWRETARAVVTRRDYLIKLGLSRRRRIEAAAEEPGGAVDSGAAEIVE